MQLGTGEWLGFAFPSRFPYAPPQQPTSDEFIDEVMLLVHEAAGDATPGTASSSASHPAPAAQLWRQVTIVEGDDKDDTPLLILHKDSWNWAVKKAPKSKVHLAPPGAHNWAFTCIKDITQCETGSCPVDAMTIVVALKRTFCNDCWRKLPERARKEIMKWMKSPPKELL